ATIPSPGATWHRREVPMRRRVSLEASVVPSSAILCTNPSAVVTKMTSLPCVGRIGTGALGNEVDCQVQRMLPAAPSLSATLRIPKSAPAWARKVVDGCCFDAKKVSLAGSEAIPAIVLVSGGDQT